MINNSPNKPHNRIVIWITLLFALILMILPLPVSQYYRPEWMLLTVTYWAMALPNRIGVLTACLLGLVVDLILGSHLGIHSLAYSIAMYLIIRFHLQLRQYPIMQQTLVIFFNALVVNLITVWLAKNINFSWMMLLPTIMSTLLWPFVFMVLRSIRRHFNIT